MVTTRDAASISDKKNALIDELWDYARKYLTFVAYAPKYLTIYTL